jgi:hypothetical protein
MDVVSAGVRLRQGSLCTVGPAGTASRVIPFQFNPDSVVRSLRRRAGRGESGPADAHRIHGAPTESITLTVELDATDSFSDRKFPDVAAALAELELLLYPTSASVTENDDLLKQGTIEITPAQGPLLLLNWGSRRSIPVRLDSLQITEQAFDPWLCPVRASVELSLQVLSYQDLMRGDAGRARFAEYHRSLEETRDQPRKVPQDHPEKRQPDGRVP